MLSSTHLLRFLLFAVSLLLLTPSSSSSIDVIPAVPSSGLSTVQFLSQPDGFDGPKVKNLNSTTWEWWYFDVVSSTRDHSAVVVFYTATPDAQLHGLPSMGTADYVTIDVTMPDGSEINAQVLGSEMTVVTVDNGSSGLLGGSATGWTGMPDMSQYAIAIDAPHSGIHGIISLESVAPAHFPCAPASAPPGQKLYLGSTPGFGWLNAVPDANAIVDININGMRVTFSGSGYHDHNWGSRPINDSVIAWYWGHGRLGPYSIVWFDFAPVDGTEIASVYLSRNNTIIHTTCSQMAVRAIGDDSVFPPTRTSPMPEGFSINATIEGKGVLSVQVTHKQVIAESGGVYGRWVGELSGGFEHDTIYSGPALYEQFSFAD